MSQANAPGVAVPDRSGSGTVAPVTERTEPGDDDRLRRVINALNKSPSGASVRLRRFHPLRQVRAVTFEIEALLDAAQISTADPDTAQRWALILHCLALAGARHGTGSGAATGRVLARLPLTEVRLRQLLDADFDLLADLLPRLARRLATASTEIDWRPLADLLLYAGTAAEVRADHARRRIVRGYIGALASADRSAPATDVTAPQP